MIDGLSMYARFYTGNRKRKSLIVLQPYLLWLEKIRKHHEERYYN